MNNSAYFAGRKGSCKFGTATIDGFARRREAMPGRRGESGCGRAHADAVATADVGRRVAAGRTFVGTDFVDRVG